MEADSKDDDAKKYDDTKIVTAIVCLFIGFLFIWNIAAHTAGIYELRLDNETCAQVKTLDIEPTSNCIITAPYRPLEIAPGGLLTLPSGNEIQITPVDAKRTNKSVEWSTTMKVQFWAALMFWGATLVLLMLAFKSKKDSK